MLVFSYILVLSLIHISEPTRRTPISYAVFCLKTIPFTAAHTYVAHIWQYSPPGLIYSKITKITSVDDMTQIMIVGIQLYSCLSLLERQSMLMVTELQGMVTVFEQFFHLEYSDSYTCNIHHYSVYATHRLQHFKHSWHWTTTHSFWRWQLLVLVSAALRLGDIMHLILMLEICIITAIVKGQVYCWKYHPCINKYNIFRLYIGMRIYMNLKQPSKLGPF